MKNINSIFLALSFFVSYTFAVISLDGSCGPHGSCREGYCCSSFGWCGNSIEYCGEGCQPQYGICNNPAESSKSTVTPINKPKTVFKTVVKTKTIIKTIVKTKTIKVTGKPTSSNVEPTSSNPKPTSSEPKPTSSEPKPTSSEPKPTSSEPKPTSSEPKPTSSEPKPTSTKPEPTPKSDEKFIIGYYSEWKYNKYPLSMVDFKKLTHINYAFALINPDTFELEFDQNIFQETVNTAHQNGVKVLMSVGGWYGSRYFTKMTSSESNMDKFVESCKKLIANTKADGIDIDWEYPGSEGACNNADMANDTKNYLTLLKKLRKAIGSSLITAAVSITPFKENGVPISDASEFANVFDFINIMAYDFAGGWSTKTSHQSCFNPAAEGDNLSFVGAVDNWKNAKFPVEKIVVGIPAYGRSFIATSTTNNGLYQSISNASPKGDSEDSNEAWTNYCGIVENAYSTIWKYKNIRKDILTSDYKTPTNGWVRSWDDVAKAPTLFNKSTKQLITYDDPESLEHKINYVNKNNLGGIMIWELEEDTDNHELLQFIDKVLD